MIPPCLSLHGILWVPDPANPGQYIKKVAQRTAKGRGNAPGFADRAQQIRAHVIPADPKTPAQLARRAAFAAAMAGWSALTPAQKQTYNDRANALKISGVNLYMRENT